MNRTIKKVAILGSGVMGSRIACHFANIGVQVLLLDIVPFELNDEEQKKRTHQGTSCCPKSDCQFSSTKYAEVKSVRDLR